MSININSVGVNFWGLKAKEQNTSTTEEATVEQSQTSKQNAEYSKYDKAMEFYLKFKAGVFSFEELCSRLETLGLNLIYEKNPDGSIKGVSFETEQGGIYFENAATSSIEQYTDSNGMTRIIESRSDGTKIETRKHPDGTIFSITDYDEQGRVIKYTQTHDDGSISYTDVTYSENGIVSRTEFNGTTYIDEYGTDGKQKSHSRYNSDGSMILTEEYSYAADGSKISTQKDGDGYLTSTSVRNANQELISWTFYNKAGEISEIHEYTHNPDGSHTEIIKNGKGEAVYKNDASGFSAILDSDASMLDGQVFELEELTNEGFSYQNIQKYFTKITGEDGKTYYKVKNARINGNLSQSIDSFYTTIMKDAADYIQLKYEAGIIKFSEIVTELNKLGFTNVTKSVQADGCPVITYQCGESSYEIVNTAPKEVVEEWRRFFLSEAHLETFVGTLEKIRGVTNVTYSEDKTGLRQITYEIDGKMYSLIQSSAVEIKEEKDYRLFDNKPFPKFMLNKMGFSDAEIQKYFNIAEVNEEYPEESEYKLKSGIEIDGEEIKSVYDLQYVIVFKRMRKEAGKEA